MSLETKKAVLKEKTRREHGCYGACQECIRKEMLIDAMSDANIPSGYWSCSMNKFTGTKLIKDIYDEYTKDIKNTYTSGKSICLAGNQGVGKTMAAVCILKKVIRTGFSGYYITASDLLSLMTDYRNNYEKKMLIKDIDFLVIDELDSRFFVSDSVKELFSGIYENLFRFRTHNEFPTIICTNETNGLDAVFYGAGVQSIRSLNNQYLKIHSLAGIDHRKHRVE